MTVRPLVQRPWQIAAAIDGRLSCVVVVHNCNVDALAAEKETDR